jgi:hypothetical protein
LLWSTADFDGSFTECFFSATSPTVSIPAEAMRLQLRSGPTRLAIRTTLIVENVGAVTLQVPGESVQSRVSHEAGAGGVLVR